MFNLGKRKEILPSKEKFTSLCKTIVFKYNENAALTRCFPCVRLHVKYAKSWITYHKERTVGFSFIPSQ